MQAFQTRATLVNDGFYNAFPWVCKNAAGTLLGVYRKGTSHVAAGGKIVLQTSADVGDSWSGESVLFTPPGGAHDFRDPVVAKTATGRIILSYFDYQGGSPETDDLYVTYSDSAGVGGWITPYTVNRYTGFTCGSGTILPHSSGVILMTVYGGQTGDVFPPNRIGVVRSTDNAASFGALIDMGSGASPSGETCLVELPGGIVRAYTRQDVVNPGPIWTATSSDVGLTWSVWSALNWNTVPGRPAATITGPGNIITLMYRRTGDGGLAYRVCSDGSGTVFGGEQLVSALSSMYAGGGIVGAAANEVGYLAALENSASDCKVIFVRAQST